MEGRSSTSHNDNVSNHKANHSHKKNKKRKRDATSSIDREIERGMGQTLSLLRQPDLPEFNLTSESPANQDAMSSSVKDANDTEEQGDWQTVENGRPKKKAKKIPKKDSANYPEISYSHDRRLDTQAKLSDLQNLVLYILADGNAPNFVAVRHRNEIRKVVVLMVPGLEREMFNSEENAKSKKADNRQYSSPDFYYPQALREETLPSTVKPFASMFKHLWPMKTPGDDKYGKMHSPLHAMLTAPTPKSKEEKNWRKNGKGGQGVKQAKEPEGWKNTRTRVTEFIHTPEELLENNYTIHPASYDNEQHKIALTEHRSSIGESANEGWVDTLVNNFEDGTVPENEIESGSLTAGREILALDCEMCMTGPSEFSLTRISIVSWDGTVVMDEFVVPDKPITDYVTMYSGITPELLEGVTTTLADIQKKLLEIITPRTILLGHSLNSDLTALKLTHPYIIDTAIIYPHPRGPPLKSSLKWLAQKYLNREVQKGHGTTGAGAGHDSVEDSRTCLDLLKQKCEKGKEWGTGDAQGENMFKRLARSGVTYKNQGGSAIANLSNGKTSAAVDWGDPKKGPGAAANFPIGCGNDEDVTNGVIRAVQGDAAGEEIPANGVDFIWARMRELEALKGWWNNNKSLPSVAPAPIQEVLAVDTKNETTAPGEIPVDDVALALLIRQLDEQNPANSTVPKVEEVSTTNALPPPEVNAPTVESIAEATEKLTTRISKIYASLPPCTALIIYSGSADPREMSRMQTMQATFKREYKIKKWDQLSVKWTDDEEQQLKRAAEAARQGIAFITVK